MSGQAERLVLLDSEPLGLGTNPRESVKSALCKTWLRDLLSEGVRVMVPEVIDYEIRRELVRAGRARGLSALDAVVRRLGLVPSSGPVWLEAAHLWAEARHLGRPTAGDKTLDIDVILAATAQLAASSGFDPVIATGNVEHLARYTNADHWSVISG